MKYRPEIDGLRAVAVVPVIFFHADIALFGGGFVGVDIFFVISGYLITSINASDLARGTFSLSDFYSRRARRILPALTLVVLSTIPVAWAIMLPGDIRNFAQSIVATAVFSSNILFWQESGYFASAAEMKPLLHTWSLAVEEQYYIIFPILLMLLWRFGLVIAGVGLAIIFSASLGLSVWATPIYPSASFYLLPTRAWELLAGALAALFLHACEWRPASRTGNVAGMTGLTLIAASFLTFDHSTQLPGLAAVLPVLGTVLVILFASEATAAGRILRGRSLVGIGLVSYSAYLWHQPILALMKYRAPVSIGVSDKIIAILLTILLSWATWKLVETPFRRSRRLAGSKALLGGMAGLVGLMLVGQQIISRPEGIGAGRRTPVYESTKRETLLSEDQFVGDQVLPPVVIWGDSFADALALPLGIGLNQAGRPMYGFIKHSCPSLLGTMRNEDLRLGTAFGPNCKAFNGRALDRLDEIGASHVVLASAYTWFMSDLNRGGEPILLSEEDPHLSGPDVVARHLRETVRAINEAGSAAIVVLPHPYADDFESVLRSGLYEKQDIDLNPGTAAEYGRHLRAALQEPPGLDVAFVSALDILCDGESIPCAVFNEHGEEPFLWKDGWHLSHYGARKVVDPILQAVMSGKD